MDNVTIKTKDAEEAAFYWTLDDKFELTNIETTEHFGRQIVWFCFSTNLPYEEVNQLRTKYNSGHCTVEPRKYSYRRQEIKRIIHERQNIS